MLQAEFTFTPLQPARNLPTARHSDPETSHEAGQEKFHWSEHRRLALRALARAGSAGLTDFDLEAATGIGQTSIGKRRLELARMGYVEKTDERRPSPSGSPAIVWRITSKGRETYYELIKETR